MQDEEMTAQGNRGRFFHGASMSDEAIITAFAVSFWLGVNVLIASISYVIVDWGL